MTNDMIDVSDTLAERDCFQQHLGCWLLEPQTASHLQHTLTEGDLETLIEQAQQGERPELMDKVAVKGNSAIVPIAGSLTKGKSSLGGTSTVEVRQALSKLSNEPDVENIVLQIDSPGGHVAGVPDLANDIKAMTRASDEPSVTAVIQDMGASAAYWIASQADRVYASNKVTNIGSIGVRTVVHDVSDKMEERGIRVVSMATGERKDDFVKGQEIDDDAIAHHQSQIEAIHDVFVETVAQGRGLTEEEVHDVSTGETFLAEQAAELGLIDGIRTVEEVVTELNQVAAASPTPVTATGNVDDDLTGDLADVRTLQVSVDLTADGSAAAPFDVAHLPTAPTDDSVTSQSLSTDQPGTSSREPTMEGSSEDGDGPDASDEVSNKEVLDAVHGLNDKVAEIDSRVSALEEDSGPDVDTEDLVEEMEKRRELQTKREDAARILDCDAEELSDAPESVLDKLLENPENAMKTEGLIDIPNAEEGAEASAQIPGVPEGNFLEKSHKRQQKAKDKLANYGKEGN